MKRLKYAMVGGGKGSFIGPIHRMAVRMDDLADLVDHLAAQFRIHVADLRLAALAVAGHFLLLQLQRFVQLLRLLALVLALGGGVCDVLRVVAGGLVLLAQVLVLLVQLVGILLEHLHLLVQLDLDGLGLLVFLECLLHVDHGYLQLGGARPGGCEGQRQHQCG